MINSIIQILLFSFISIFLLVSSLTLRSGLTYLTNRKNVFSSVFDEFQRVVEQVSINTFYTGLDKIYGLNRLDQQKLLDAVGITEGMEISPNQYSKLFDYLRKYPWVEDISIEKSIFPKRIKINVKETEPAFVIEYSGDSWLLSDKGKLIEPLSNIYKSEVLVEAINLPRLYDEFGVENEHTTLTTTAQRIQTAIRILDYYDLAGGLPFSYSTLKIMPYGDLLIEIKEGAPTKEIILSAHNITEAKERLAQLKSVFSDLNQRGETAQQIDTRYSSQIIVR